MKQKMIYSSIAAALLWGSAGLSAAAQQLVCDQQPTSTTSASCQLRDIPASSQPAGSSYYIVEPAASERVMIREPGNRVVVREPSERVVVGEPVDSVVMSYPIDDAFPDPNPRQEAQTRVYVPREPVRVTERGFFGEVTPD